MTAGRIALATLVLAAAGCSSPSSTDQDGGVPTPTDTDDPTAPLTSPLADHEHVGSAHCQPCHAVIAEEWRASSHATTVRDADFEDEDRVDSMIECSGLEFTHVLGDRHHVRYLVEDDDRAPGSGRWLALPCGWDVHEQRVTAHHVDDWQSLPWESSCAPCHVTGFVDATHDFLELGIGCEECHGPGGRHVTTASSADVFSFANVSAADESVVCASCHLQDGTSERTGRSFPDRYVPGGSLFDDYRFDWNRLESEGDEKPLDAHQKHVIRATVFDGDDSLRCTSCHSMHGLGHERHQDVAPHPLCQSCHEADSTLKEYSQSCNVCEF